MTTLTSPLDLLNAVPFLIGFQPKDSIVILSLREEAIDILTLVKGSKAHDSAEDAGAQPRKRMKKARHQR